jgi:pimeloyl-ACP methyl ester carboxylesterase
MPVEVIMPKVDMDMTHGTLAVWHVAEGAAVAQGAALFDIETDKAAMEVEAPVAGRLHHIRAAPGDKVAVGTAVAWLYPDGEVVGPAPTTGAGPAPPEAADEPTAQRTTTPLTIAVAEAEATASARATPAARAAARAAGIVVADVPGSGPLGRVQRDDVAAFLDTSPQVHSAAVWVPQPGPLHVTRRPGAGTPVLLIHGFTADSQSWAPLEKALGASRGLIRLDLPGHGKSPRRRITGFADLARMTVEAFDDATRDLDQVHIVGHSLGGAAALAIADLRARRTASITLIAPAGLGPEIDADALNGIVRASRTDSLAPWLRRLTAMPDGISDDYARAAMRLRQDPALRACQADMADVLFPDGVQAFDLRPALARLDRPAQILWGRQDHILPVRQVLAADGDFGIHLLTGAGHVPQIECPDRVAKIISRLIAAADAPV